MREIRFRAWATKSNKMIDLKAITPLALDKGILDEGDGLFIPFRKDIILMQYTGLKDKNRIDIYEGDIIRRSTGYVFEMMPTLYSMGKSTCVHGYQHDNEDEIIGNIYQHKHLLTTIP